VPSVVSKGGLEVETTGARSTLEGVFELSRAQQGLLELRLGGGVDVQRTRPIWSATSTWEAAGTTTNILPHLRGALRPAWDTGSVELFVDASAVLLLRSLHYDVEEDGRTREWVRFWTLQPAVACGAQW
jgi:hypothetical protein